MPANINYAVAPGEHLEEWIESSATSLSTVASALGCTEIWVRALIRGAVPLTEPVAVRLEHLTGTPAYIWMRFEHGYQDDLSRLRIDRPTTENLTNANL